MPPFPPLQFLRRWWKDGNEFQKSKLIICRSKAGEPHLEFSCKRCLALWPPSRIARHSAFPVEIIHRWSLYASFFSPFSWMGINSDSFELNHNDSGIKSDGNFYHLTALVLKKIIKKTKQKHRDFCFGPHQSNGPIDANQNRLLRLYACFSNSSIQDGQKYRNSRLLGYHRRAGNSLLLYRGKVIPQVALLLWRRCYSNRDAKRMLFSLLDL